MRDASENARQTAPAPICATEAPARDYFVTLPSDGALIGFLAAYPRRSLAEICKRFGVPYNTTIGDYTPETRAVSNQLQRLRKARKISCNGMRWEVW